MRGIPHTAGRGGKHHALALSATIALMLAMPGSPAHAQGDPALEGSRPAADLSAANFTQRGVPAEASAENAVVARDRALTNGQRAAWMRLAQQLGITRPASDAQIESMVSSFVIEDERIAGTRYAGRITVNFSPGRVRAFGGGGEVSGVASADRADPSTGERLPPPVAPSSTIDATARYGSFAEWTEMRRRLAAAAPIARIDIVGISIDRARLRVGLRGDPEAVAADLARIGITLSPAAGGAGGAGWRLGLAGGT